jgi:hypothetical protein
MGAQELMVSVVVEALALEIIIMTHFSVSELLAAVTAEMH